MQRPVNSNALLSLVLALLLLTPLAMPGAARDQAPVAPPDLVDWPRDRLGRSLPHLLRILQDMDSKDTRLLMYAMVIAAATPRGDLFCSRGGACAAFGRALVAERVRARMDLARRKEVRIDQPLVTDRRGFSARFGGVLKRLLGKDADASARTDGA